jgi:hypothetical protein
MWKSTPHVPLVESEKYSPQVHQGKETNSIIQVLNKLLFLGVSSLSQND